MGLLAGMSPKNPVSLGSCKKTKNPAVIYESLSLGFKAEMKFISLNFTVQNDIAETIKFKFNRRNLFQSNTFADAELRVEEELKLFSFLCKCIYSFCPASGNGSRRHHYTLCTCDFLLIILDTCSGVMPICCNIWLICK